MSTFLEIKDAIDRQATAFEAFKDTNEKRISALESGNTTRAAELETELKKVEADVQKFSELKKTIETEMQLNRERLEELEAKEKTPGKTAEQKLANEYTATFTDWIRQKGQSAEHEAKMSEIQRKAKEMKAVTIGTGSAGGFAVPEEIAREIERLERKFSPVRDLVKVVQVGSSDYKELVSIGGAASGWVGESGTRSETATSALREVTPTHGELYAYPQASEWSLDDIFFNVESWLAEETAQEFAVQEGTAVISGDGTSKPTGMLNTTPVTTEDDAGTLRAAAAYQYVASAGGVVLADQLIALIYKLNSRYRANATFTMNSNTAAAVRQLKDTTNQYLWAPGLAAGEPDRLLGYPHRTWEQMDDVSATNFPIAFGDFRRGYVMADRVGLRITRDNVTNVGFVRFYIRRREGGIVLNNDAIKFLGVTA